MIDATKTKKTKDLCPAWAELSIEQLRQVEVLLGNITDGPSWSSSFLKKVSERTYFTKEQVFDERKVEYIFQTIVKKLSEENFSPQTVADFINKRIPKTNNLNYCSEEEVIAALKTKTANLSDD